MTGQVENSDITQPTRAVSGLDSFQAVRIPATPKLAKKPFHSGVVIFSLFALVMLIYFLAPIRTNILILGIDSGLGRGDLGRTDTIILTTISPLKPNVGMLSIPRDLWVPIEGVGVNRINTAYFYAEAEKIGSGPSAALKVVSQNFHVPVEYYLILRMDGLLDFINSLGGVDITLVKPGAGYPVGTFHLDGQAALAFARSRAGADDFSRMAQGQVLIKAVVRRLLQPEVWPHLLIIYSAVHKLVELNIPFWQWPRLGLSVLRIGTTNIDSRTISRDMVHPFTTNQGAQVLEPNWVAIGVLTQELFGK